VWQKKNLKKVRQYRVDWLAKPENRAKRRVWQRQYDKRTRDLQLIAKASRPRPINCESCGDATEGTHRSKLCFDHHHDTGRFRGWLCYRCNSALGFLLDDPQRIAALAAYLRGTMT
jgi:Recombination endonuclease VII